MWILTNHWLWLIAAAALGIGELIVPGVFLIWIGLAALVTGIAALLLPLSVEFQFLLFAIAAVVAVYAGRNYLLRNPITSSDPNLNDRGARMIGSVVVAVEPVNVIGGRVRVGDTIWSARGTTASAGDALRVVAVEGGVLIVEHATP